jgi:uncharacterized RDD family membrane protein YckC
MADSARVLTTQNVFINYQVASIGERLLARLLDLVFFAVYLIIAYYIAGAAMVGLSFTEEGRNIQTIIQIVILLPVLTYTLWCEPLFNGRSIGKLIIGLKVVKMDGTPASIGDSAFRWIMRLLEGEGGIFACLSLPVAIVSEKGQRVGDMIAGTIMIRSKQKSSLRNTIIQQINPNYRVVFPQVSNLSDRDMNIIRDVMQQAFDTGNYGLLEYLAHKVKTIMNVFPPPQQLPTVQFLNIVLADYAHYNFEGEVALRKF